MSVTAPTIDSRTYQALLDDAIARIATHNPEWTNFNESDPGITLLELFAFLTDSLLYRANLIPERNRLKFLNLLGVPLTRAATAIGLATLSYDHGPLETQLVTGAVELRAGSVSFHTDSGLEVLPVEAQVFAKQVLTNPPPAVVAQQQQLYASFAVPPATPADLTLYETVPLDPKGSGVTIADTPDGSLWVALLLRAGDAAGASGPALEQRLETARQQLAGSTLTLGYVPVIAASSAPSLEPATTTTPIGNVALTVSAPMVPADGQVPTNDGVPAPTYLPLDVTWPANGVGAPGVAQVTLPGADGLKTWAVSDPLMPGVGEMPPSLDGTNLAPRLITWLRLAAQIGDRTTMLWLGINAVTVTQRTHVSGEVLPPGNGEPDQTVTLARTPVIPESVFLTVTEPGGTVEQWTQIDDMLSAAPEIPVRDPRLPPGTPLPAPGDANVYTLDPTTGLVTFGDGARGRRPPPGATMNVEYDYGAGSAGNVGAGALTTGVALPSGVTVTNPVPTWGGADAESIDEAEKQTARYLQHRDRLVTAEDFQVIVYRTPGVHLGRVEVLPAASPDVAPFTPGSAPGAVTVMVIPSSDPVNPDAPEPDNATLEAISAYLDPRRLVTTQILLRGPVYKGIWVSVGIDVVAGASASGVTAAVKQQLKNFLAPLNPAAAPWYQDLSTSIDNPLTDGVRGWPLAKDVIALELQAVASRVDGVDYVQPVVLAPDGGGAVDHVPMSGLELPELVGIGVVTGDPMSLDALRGTAGAGTGAGGGGGTGTTAGGGLVPVPVIPDVC